MLVKHVSMSAFSWQHNFIHVPVLSLCCVADAGNSAVSDHEAVQTVARIELD